jgi:putative DNA methylase
MNLHVAEVISEVVPFSLKGAPSLIERIFPSMKISAEAQKERKAGAGQTLTALGSYWKGRKPLILVKACVLGCLLPATNSPEKDLEVFEMLMGIDDAAFFRREKKLGVHDFARKAVNIGYINKEDLPSYFHVHSKKNITQDDFEACLSSGGLAWSCTPEEIFRIRLAVYSSLPYEEKVAISQRPEEIGDRLYEDIWPTVNRHLGTTAASLESLVEQLGVMRFGHPPTVSDTFAGGGSIPFEAALLGCNVYASDLNPIACMLTWGALNLVGGTKEFGAQFKAEQSSIVEKVEAEITRLGIEHDAHGNRAKAFLYCLETLCPATGWMVPMLPSFIVSKARNIVVTLVPDHNNKRYNFELQLRVDAAGMKEAELGTVRNGRLVHPANQDASGVAITQIRGDHKSKDGVNQNNLRMWENGDFVARAGDIFQERLFCIQWVSGKDLSEGKSISRADAWFAIATKEDLEREAKAESIVRENLAAWQREGYVPDMLIELGEKTEEPIRTRGWTHWHHLFNARQLMMHALFCKYAADSSDLGKTAAAFSICAGIDRNSRLVHWNPGSRGRAGVAPTGEKIEQVFYNQAFNTFLNPPTRSFASLANFLITDVPHYAFKGAHEVLSRTTTEIDREIDIYITDPPYADAVNYHELTEYFIAWLRKTPARQFSNWHWDSRRRLAIKGKGEEFRARMVEAYRTMANHMPDNGIQIVMFTHQDGKVWSDMTQIFWGAGLQVMADWYIATETSSELKRGGYVQGTHIIVLRKRPAPLSGYSDEISQEVKEEVALQIEEMTGLNQTLRGQGRSENLFNDADLQMAGYAAALRVLTKYVKIDGKDMTVEAMRPQSKNERTIVDEIIEYAVQVANEHLVPEGMDEQTWRRLSGAERFYLKMLDIESTGAKKVDNYQNFAKAFRVADRGSLMASEKANDAALKAASDFGKRQMGDDEFGRSL